MARRDVRQPGLADGAVRRRGKRSEWLDRPAPGTVVAGVDASREGGPSHPLPTCVELPPLQRWYGLSDEGPEAAADDRPSSRRLAGIPRPEGVPDHGSAWRFRERPAERGLAAGLLAEVDRPPDARGLILRRGTLIDATVPEADIDIKRKLIFLLRLGRFAIQVLLLRPALASKVFNRT